MPNAHHNIRHLVQLELVDRIRLRLPVDGPIVRARWPGEEMELDAIYVGNTTGPVAVKTFGTGLGQRARRADDFTMTVFVQGGDPAGDEAVSLTRAALWLAAVEDVVALDPRLGDLPGLDQLAPVIDLDGPETFVGRAGVFTLYTLGIHGNATYD